MAAHRCSHQGCGKPAPCGCGWGMHGITQWWCREHFQAALDRLAGLLRGIGVLI